VTGFFYNVFVYVKINSVFCVVFLQQIRYFIATFFVFNDFRGFVMTKINLLAVAVAGLVLAGCSSTPTEEGSKTTAAPATPVVGAAAASAPAATGEKVYFDFDRAEIKPEFIPVIKAQAAYLKANAAKSVTLEGHCDERGTREYNLALGERRAKSVAEVMMANGIDAKRIKTVSFGEDRPDVEGHDESAWSKNRRVEFNVQ
jgi:peptidoglycan-associated lipoprotein